MCINVFKIWQRYLVVIIFYDGYCLLCIVEMCYLRKRDKYNKLILVDIQVFDFLNCYLIMDWYVFNVRIYGFCEDGMLIIGFDVIYEVWKVVGMGWLYVLFCWFVICYVVDVFYNVFVKYRYIILYLLIGKKCQCDCCILGEVSEK